MRARERAPHIEAEHKERYNGVKPCVCIVDEFLFVSRSDSAFRILILAWTRRFTPTSRPRLKQKVCSEKNERSGLMSFIGQVHGWELAMPRFVMADYTKNRLLYFFTNSSPAYFTSPAMNSFCSGKKWSNQNGWEQRGHSMRLVHCTIRRMMIRITYSQHRRPSSGESTQMKDYIQHQTFHLYLIPGEV